MNITPASQREVTLYYPYYPQTRRSLLPVALGIYKLGIVEGHRRIEGASKKEIPFCATWPVRPVPLPADLTVCRVEFFVPDKTGLIYEFAFKNTDFMGYLLDLAQNLNEGKAIDFPQTFYKRLLGYA